MSVNCLFAFSFRSSWFLIWWVIFYWILYILRQDKRRGKWHLVAAKWGQKSRIPTWHLLTPRRQGFSLLLREVVVPALHKASIATCLAGGGAALLLLLFSPWLQLAPWWLEVRGGRWSYYSRTMVKALPFHQPPSDTIPPGRGRDALLLLSGCQNLGSPTGLQWHGCGRRWLSYCPVWVKVTDPCKAILGHWGNLLEAGKYRSLGFPLGLFWYGWGEGHSFCLVFGRRKVIII